MAERDMGIAVVAEPYRIPNGHPHWAGSRNGTVAITWRQTTTPLACTPMEDGETILIGVYLSPNIDLAQFDQGLDELEGHVRRYMGRPLIVAGDFNAKTALWGSPITNTRGRMLEKRAVTMGLCCLNRGNTSTCVRSTEESIVDIMFANSLTVKRVSDWRVLPLETMADHLYIEATLGETNIQNRKRGFPYPQRWVTARIDEDQMVAAILVGTWVPLPPKEEWNVESETRTAQNLMVQACDVAMPRAAPRPRRIVHWWSQSIAELRDCAMRARRMLKRARQAQPPEKIEEKVMTLRASRKALSRAISAAKEKAWADLALTLNEDPWERPYKIVLDKLRQWAPPLTEAMEQLFLQGILGALSPPPPPCDDMWTEPSLPLGEWSSWSPDYEVSAEELLRATKRMLVRAAAPGPSGVHAKSWTVALRTTLGQNAEPLHGMFEKRNIPVCVEARQVGAST
ncbi:PREDICTED: uncharacterized protein LOC108761074 [Trachymyrmex cornetzi]|uniref:uncharacterized protein LOC108761074 n=1 Tax=Trachymyrmex cornetzi TaxID=471704 RepID=UPI00084EFADB|nr:PREDICTED: uncharacterized protein LOC108761074 [Trachymyrmex cornetzi]